MGFIGSIKNRNCVLDGDKDSGIPDLVTALLKEDYDVEYVTLRNGRREINLKKDRKGISVQYRDGSGHGDPREDFRLTMDLLQNK